MRVGLLDKLTPRGAGPSRADLINVALLALAGWRLTRGLESAVDILLYDESFYLFWGATLAETGLPGPALSPLYALWYFGVSLLEPDRIGLYYLNYKVLTIVPPLLVYALLRGNAVAVPASLIAAWLFLVSRINVLTWPKVSHFALVVILFSLILAGWKRTLPWMSLCAAIGALLASYVRPEYFPAYLLASALFIVVVIREFRLSASVRRYAGSYGLLSALLLGIFGLPVDGDRGLLAFGQHFSLNWVAWNGSALNPWTNWLEIVRDNFGPVRSLPEALASNPAAIVQHLASNFRQIVTLAPPLALPIAVPMAGISLALAALLVVGLLVWRRPDLGGNFAGSKGLLGLIGLFMLPAGSATIILFPRDHYLLVPGVLSAVAACVLLANRATGKNRENSTRLLVPGLLLLLLALTPALPGAGSSELQNIKTIRYIHSLGIPGSVNVLEAEGGVNMYLGDNYQRVAEYDKHGSFEGFRATRRINMILVSERLLQDNRFASDPEWQSFLAGYQRFGFRQLAIPGTGRWLLVEASLLQDEHASEPRQLSL